MNPEIINSIAAGHEVQLSGAQNVELTPLKEHLERNIRTKIEEATAVNDDILVMDADWCRDHSEEAGNLHANIIVEAYGPTYALPNKNPEANTIAIEKGELDLYLMKTNGVLTGTACMVDNGDNRAELGRAASLGRSRNTIIQDLRILNWLNRDDVAEKYHTLFATLRSAPDRPIILEGGSDFVMRGGQAVTEHWRKFPGLMLYGVAPLYLKAEKLEQFSYVSVSRTILRNEVALFVGNEEHREFVSGWHAQYQLSNPEWRNKEKAVITDEGNYEVHYPPIETGLTEFVHADIVQVQSQTKKTLEECVHEAVGVGSPFIQVEVPVENDTLQMQSNLMDNGFMLYGYKPPTSHEEASLLFGRLREGVNVVQTAWDADGKSNPFWNITLGKIASNISRSWK